MTQQTQNKMLEALVQNYDFKKAKYETLPSVDFVYPNYTADGNSEEFRFSSNLRNELAKRSDVVREDLKGKNLVWTLNEKTMYEIAKIAPRLGLEEQMSGAINSIYSYSPILFVGQNDSDFSTFIVKPLVNTSMAWFELTSKEKNEVRALLEKKAEARPYKTFFQRLFSGDAK